MTDRIEELELENRRLAEDLIRAHSIINDRRLAAYDQQLDVYEYGVSTLMARSNS